MYDPNIVIHHGQLWPIVRMFKFMSWKWKCGWIALTIMFHLYHNFAHARAVGLSWQVQNGNLNQSELSKLEQLERLRSEDTPRRLMITHTIESYWIPSQKMTKSKLQILKIRQNFKFLNFETGITRDTPSQVAW